MLRKILLTLLLSFFALPVLGEIQMACKRQDPNNLVIAQWGGLWEKDKQSGYFRVLVYRTGWEHTHDLLQTEVMVRDEKAKKIRMLRCMQVKDNAANYRIVKSLKIQDTSRTKADVRVVYQAAPFIEGDKVFVYSVDISGKLSRK